MESSDIKNSSNNHPPQQQFPFPPHGSISTHIPEQLTFHAKPDFSTHVPVHVWTTSTTHDWSAQSGEFQFDITWTNGQLQRPASMTSPMLPNTSPLPSPSPMYPPSNSPHPNQSLACQPIQKVIMAMQVSLLIHTFLSQECMMTTHSVLIPPPLQQRLLLVPTCLLWQMMMMQTTSVPNSMQQVSADMAALVRLVSHEQVQ